MKKAHSRNGRKYCYLGGKLRKYLSSPLAKHHPFTKKDEKYYI